MLYLLPSNPLRTLDVVWKWLGPFMHHERSSMFVSLTHPGEMTKAQMIGMWRGNGRVRKQLSPVLAFWESVHLCLCPLRGATLYEKTKILPMTVSSRALLAPFHGTFAISARPEKACFHKIWGKEATTLPRISLGTTETLCNPHFLEVSCDCPLPNSGALSPSAHFSLAHREGLSGSNFWIIKIDYENAPWDLQFHRHKT